MRYLVYAIVYGGFFGVIGVACWVTKSSLPLCAFIFFPTVSWGTDGKP